MCTHRLRVDHLRVDSRRRYVPDFVTPFGGVGATRRVHRERIKPAGAARPGVCGRVVPGALSVREADVLLRRLLCRTPGVEPKSPALTTESLDVSIRLRNTS